jgi:NADH-quinone oxidoreductase subunit F
MSDAITTSASPDERPLTAAFRADGRPAGIADYEAAGGYEALRTALRELAPAEVTKLVSDSGLRGRGGAGYATGRKWSFVPLGDDAPPVKYVVCNGDEMEPGSFKDRFLIEGDPHLLIEGMILACYAIQATTGYIFLRAQYDKPYALLTQAIAEAKARGYLGEHILGSEFSLEIHLHVSIGRYMCGEASGMLNALQSDRPNPRWRPPHMASAGLWSRPTVVNNVESLCCVPAIVRLGPERWRALGASDEGGTRIYGVSGRARRTGAWELPVGTPMREVIEQHAGGLRDGFELRAVLPGGASTPFVPAAAIDVLMDFDHMKQAGYGLGTATMLLVDQSVCPVGLTLNLVRFFAQESCGWCTPCWAGLPWTVDILTDIEEGRGRPEQLDLLAEHIWFLTSETCFCDLAPSAMKPLGAALTLFRDDFERHIAEGGCRHTKPGRLAGVAPAGDDRPAEGAPAADDPPTGPAPAAGLPGMAPNRRR